jgi:LPXTG-motif cell wall-anchored protein
LPLLAATPARAAAGGADLQVSVSGTSLDYMVGGKRVTITVTNRGPASAHGVELSTAGSWVDFETVDPGSIRFCQGRPPLPQPTHTPPDERTADTSERCKLPDLGPGRSVQLDTQIVYFAKGNKIGNFARIAPVVSHSGTDPVPANNAAEAGLAAPAVGPDLFVRAADLEPGATPKLRFQVGNQGSQPSVGLKVAITLPAHVTFDGAQAGCTYNAGLTEAACAYPDLQLTRPATGFDVTTFTHPVRVGDGAPAYLLDGSVSVEPISVATDAAAAAAAAVTDVDATDNADAFSVFAASGGENLPATGVRSGVIALYGGVAVLIGAALLLVVRRRRTRT